VHPYTIKCYINVKQKDNLYGLKIAYINGIYVNIVAFDIFSYIFSFVRIN